MIPSDISISGAMQMSSIGLNLSLRSFDTVLEIHQMEVDFENFSTDNDEYGDQVSEFLETHLLMVLSEHHIAVSDMIREIVMPIANKILGEMALSDLLGMIGSGSGYIPGVPPHRKKS